MKTTFVYLLVDETVSMRGHQESARQALNRQIESLKAASVGQELVTILPIRDRATNFTTYRQPVHAVTPCQRYRTDAPATDIVSAIQRVDEDRPYLTGDDAVLVILVTDGENNQRYSELPETRRRIASMLSTDAYTFAFSVPVGYRDRVIQTFGLPSGCVQEWEQSERGFEEMSLGNEHGTQSYFTARAGGLRSVGAFYTTNIDRPTEQKIINDVPKLDPAAVSEFVVPRSMPIKDFFGEIGMPFRTGRLYYELMKGEEVQPQKTLIIRRRSNPDEMHSGRAAREVLGLPNHHCKVQPGVHGDWRIFVQSTSSNRKLVGGTTALLTR